MAVVGAFEKLTRNKTIALVGPASYLEGLGFGNLIDSHDLVFRVGKNLPTENFYEDYGSRTDLLYLTDGKWPPPCKVRYIGSAYPCHNQTHSILGRYRLRQIRAMTQPKGPTKGFVALQDLLDQNTKKVTVFGYTFLQDFTEEIYAPFYNPIPKLKRAELLKSSCHDFNKEFRFFRNFLVIYPQMELDPFLQKHVDPLVMT